MPFDEEDDDIENPAPTRKVGLKQVSSQKSIFESIPKKPSQEDLDNRVKGYQDKASRYKERAASLAVSFNKTMQDKTLAQNKNAIQKDMESDVLRNMIRLSQEINSDIEERDGEGSLIWITLLLKTCFNQRDRINKLEYLLSQFEKKTDPAHLNELINAALDAKKKSE